MSTDQPGMFRTPDGRNLLFTFIIVSSLFLLWGFCNGMIDVMDKHFQEELHLSYAQSAWVQFAHYLGYFIMSLPAGWLAIRLGYKGGIITGLLLVAVGGIWFVPATHIAAFWAFLLGVCVIASGLTFLETVANPYTTVLGAPRYAAARINLAQSCNGVGWILGPIAGGLFFYGKNESGQSTGSQTLWIPYAGVALVVLVLAAVFCFAQVPDIKTEDEYHLDDADAKGGAAEPRSVNRGLAFALVFVNVAVLIGICGMILWAVLNALGAGRHVLSLAAGLPHPASLKLTNESALAIVLGWIALVSVLIAFAILIPALKKISHHNIWTHEHFSGATLAQFFYVAAQSCVFASLIFYMTTQPPPIPAAFDTHWTHRLFDTSSDGVLHISDQGASTLASFGFLCFLIGRVIGALLLRRFSAHKVLGLYATLNVLIALLVFCKLAWVSVACVFLIYFFMSIMFPTIFALGIHGLGVRAKKAAGFIVMGIMGGAIMPKVMGAVADRHDWSRGFIVPLLCFIPVALYGYCWPLLSRSESLRGLSTSGGHAPPLERTQHV